MLKRMSDELTATLQGAIMGMDGAQTVALTLEARPNAEGFSDDRRYLAEMDWFAHVKTIEPRAWLYSYVRGSNENEVLFVSDLWARYEVSRAAGFLEPLVDEMMTQGLEEITLDSEPYCDKWGCWVSIYGPLKDAQGNLVAGLGLDFEANQVVALQRRILRNILLVIAITYSLGMLLVIWLAGLFTRPLQRLSGLAKQVGEGNYNLDFSILKSSRIWDETDRLAKIFVVMVDKVYQREQVLVQKVQTLQIKIDEAKAQRSVQEITESEYFHELQMRIGELRSKKK